MKTIVIYKSRSGFTKKYAQWIAEEMSADLFDFSKAKIKDICSYDNIIYGGNLHAVGIDGVKIITGNMDKLTDKKIAVFGVGASPAREEAIKEVVKSNFTPEQQESIKFFYLRGGFNYDNLPAFDKILMKLLKAKLKRKVRKNKPMTPDEKGMLSGYDKPLDFTRKENVKELVDYIKS